MKRDTKQFRDICRKHKMSSKQRRQFGRYVHRLKAQGHLGAGKGGDFTFDELDQLANEFMTE